MRNERRKTAVPCARSQAWISSKEDVTDATTLLKFGGACGAQKGAVSKWLKEAKRGSAYFRIILRQAKPERRKNGTQGIAFKGILRGLGYKPAGKDEGAIRPLPKRLFWIFDADEEC